jgi:hypothetical protein
MRKILKIDKITNLTTIEVEGIVYKNKIGDIITDDTGNILKIKSVAMVSSYNYPNTILVIEPLKTVVAWGSSLNVE